MNKCNKEGRCTVKDNEDNATVCSEASSRKLGDPCRHCLPIANKMGEQPDMICENAGALNKRMINNIAGSIFPNHGHGNTGNEPVKHVVRY